jgi:hypothetical protein
MIWRVSLYEDPDDRELVSRECATINDAASVAGELEDPAYDNRYIRFQTPSTATDAEIETLRQLGLVNGESPDAF